MEALATGYGLIEGPVWDAARGLLFSDVLFGGVYCLDRAGGVSTVFEHRRGIGGMALHEAGGVVVSGRNVSFKAFSGGPTKLLLDSAPERDNVGYNDLTTDTVGRVYVGSLGSSPVFDDGRPPRPGALHRIDLDGSAKVVAEGIELTNGLGFSADGSRLFHSDSRAGTVWSYDVQDSGDLSEKQAFARIETGSPDGLAVAADGSVWVALAGGHGVQVFEPDGSPRRFLQIPLPMATSVCFGGDDLRELYVVSGSRGADGDRAGSVFRVSVEVPGLPVPVARVALPE